MTNSPNPRGILTGIPSSKEHTVEVVIAGVAVAVIYLLARRRLRRTTTAVGRLVGADATPAVETPARRADPQGGHDRGRF